jgi:(p)ppGpp synthase/HD superfamily hydrolase
MNTNVPRTKNGSLEHAIDIATKAHQGQVDKAGEPFILHPMRVMKNMVSEDEKIVAALHDVVEHNPEWTLSRLTNEGFSKNVIRGVDAMTRRPGESYEHFVLRAGRDPIGRTVKLADLNDNIYMSEVGGLDSAHIDKYRRAIDLIRSNPS